MSAQTFSLLLESVPDSGRLPLQCLCIAFTLIADVSTSGAVSLFAYMPTCACHKVCGVEDHVQQMIADLVQLQDQMAAASEV